MWEPEVKKKDNKPPVKRRDNTKRKDSTESFTYTPKQKGTDFKVEKKVAKPQKKSKKISLEDPAPKPKDPNTKAIERLLGKNGSKYLVKWVNLSEDENTWLQKSAIPKQLLKVLK